jgi:hypothetical protein
MKKPIQSFFRLFGVVLLLGLSNSVLAASLSFEPSITTTPGGDFSINLVGQELSDIYAYQFSISYNPEILKAIGVTEGSFLSTGGNTFFIPGTIDNTTGVISFTGNTLIGNIPGVNGSGALATLKFEGILPGISTLFLKDTLFLNSTLSDVSVVANNGSVTVSSTPTQPQGIPTLSGWAMILLSLILISLAGSRLQVIIQTPGAKTHTAA